MSEPITSVKTFVSIWIALLIFTGITVAVAYLNLGAFSVVVALCIATIKSLLVALFFMEARYSPAITKIVMLAGLLWLSIHAAAESHRLRQPRLVARNLSGDPSSNDPRENNQCHPVVAAGRVAHIARSWPD